MLPNWHAKYYIEGETCLLLNQVMKGEEQAEEEQKSTPGAVMKH